MMELSESEEEYLEALYKLNGRGGQVRVGKLAEELQVKEPSVVEMLKKLEKKNLVDYERYSGAKLTDRGKEEGMSVTRKHRLAERLLSDVLDLELPEIHDEACKLEHSIGNDTADKIARVLENPETCPHGYPIPEEEKEEDENLIELTEGEEGEEYRVITIPEKREDIQRLIPLAILPGSKIELADKPPFSALMVERGGDKLALSRDLASKIMVKPHGRRKRRRHRSGSGRQS